MNRLVAVISDDRSTGVQLGRPVARNDPSADKPVNQFRFDRPIDDFGDRLLVVFSQHGERSEDNWAGCGITKRPSEPAGTGSDERRGFSGDKPECP